MAMLRVLVLGSPGIEVDGKPVPLGRRKVAALVLYLATTGRRHTRDSLAHLLYPRHGRDRAFADLRQSLSILKAAIGTRWLDNERGSVGLADHKGLGVDLREFRRLAAGHGEGDLSRAADLVRGPFLSGFYLQDSPAFEEWQAREAEAIQREHTIVLGRLLDIHEGRSDYARAIEVCGRLRGIDPLDEATVRRMMRLCASAGRRVAAHHEYETFRQALYAEMGQRPDIETHELRDRILLDAGPGAGLLRGSSVIAPAVLPAPAPGPPACLAVGLSEAASPESPETVKSHASVQAALSEALRIQRDSGGDARIAIHVKDGRCSADGSPGAAEDTEERARSILRAASPGCIVLSAVAAMHAGGRLDGTFSIRAAGRHRLDDLGPMISLSLLVRPGEVPGPGVVLGLDSVSNNLRLQPTRFIGRKPELAVAAAYLHRDPVRLLTLAGPGGAGKTRLALQVAARAARGFDHGAFLVDLAAVSKPSGTEAAILGALGVAEGPCGSHITLVEHLRPRRMLLVLDNYEHLLPAGSEVAADLLAVCPGLKLLVTSRAPLRVRAEHVMRVEPLNVPEPSCGFVDALSSDAIALFEDCAHRAQPGFRVDQDNIASVIDLCRRLDGLPLAIELAAARLQDLGLAELAGGLESRLETLSDGPRDLPQRQRALRSELDWSYDLLDETERRVFRNLAVLVGDWDEEAASAVCAEGSDRTAGGILHRLVRMSLVQRRRRGRRSCYRLLETVREYGVEKLRSQGERHSAIARLADYAVRMAETTEPTLFGPEGAAGLDRLELHYESIRHSLDWMHDNGMYEPGSRLAAAMGWFWFRRSKFAEGKRWLERYEGTAAGSAIVRARIAYYLGWMEISAGNRFQGNLRSRDWFLRSLERFRAAGDAPGEARSLAWVGNMSLDQPVEGRYRMCDEGIELARRSGDPWTLALCLKVGTTYQRRTDLEPAARVALAQESIAAAKRSGDPYLVAETIHGLGDVYFFLADHASAEVWFRRSLRLARESGSTWLVCDNLWQIALGYAARDRFDEARGLYREGLRLAESTGDRGHYVWYLRGLARVSRHEGRTGRLLRLAGAADNLEDAQGVFPRESAAWSGEEPARAAALWEEGRRMSVDRAVAYALSDDD